MKNAYMQHFSIGEFVLTPKFAGSRQHGELRCTMFIFYQDENGKQPVKEYLDELEEKSAKSKDARIKYNKIDQYIGILMECGTAAGEPYIKHLDGEIWELRPLRDRILFFGWDGSSFILLSHFMKSIQKTPKREIEKAKRLMGDFKERSQKNG